MTDCAEKGRNDTRVSSDTDECRGVLGEELIHKETKTEGLLLRGFLVNFVPLFVVLGERAIKVVARYHGQSGFPSSGDDRQRRHTILVR